LASLGGQFLLLIQQIRESYNPFKRLSSFGMDNDPGGKGVNFYSSGPTAEVPIIDSATVLAVRLCFETDEWAWLTSQDRFHEALYVGQETMPLLLLAVELVQAFPSHVTRVREF
jgi:hypothetical protein